MNAKTMQGTQNDREAIELLILQPTPFCNINCDYCYLPDRSNPKKMPGEVIDSTIELVMRSGLVLCQPVHSLLRNRHEKGVIPSKFLWVTL